MGLSRGLGQGESLIKQGKIPVDRTSSVFLLENRKGVWNSSLREGVTKYLGDEK